jgi:hypothetical protein
MHRPSVPDDNRNNKLLSFLGFDNSSLIPIDSSNNTKASISSDQPPANVVGLSVLSNSLIFLLSIFYCSVKKSLLSISLSNSYHSLLPNTFSLSLFLHLYIICKPTAFSDQINLCLPLTMDSLLHSCHKIMLEQQSSGNNEHPQHSPDAAAPPAYTQKDDMAELEDIGDECQDEDPSPVTLTINAGSHINGSGNMIAAPPLADSTRLSTLLLAAIQSLNHARSSDTSQSFSILHVDLTINCGITVNGDGNVIGYKTQGVLPHPLKRKSVGDEVCLLLSSCL